MTRARDRAAVAAVVSVEGDDTSAPHGCGALRVLAGRSLLERSVAALAGSGAVARVVVAVPPGLADAVRAALPDAPGAVVDVLAVDAAGPGGLLLAALRATPGDVVVVHDPLYCPAPAALVRAVVDALGPGVAGAVPARPVPDTLKWVRSGAGGDVVTGTADRQAYREVATPQAYRRGPLVAALEGAGEGAQRACGAEVLPQLLRARGERLALVPATQALLRVTTAADLALVAALLGEPPPAAPAPGAARPPRGRPGTSP